MNPATVSLAPDAALALSPSNVPPSQPTPLDDITAQSPVPVVEAALRRMVAQLNGADPLRRELTREAAVAKLRAVGVSAPGRLVDIALAERRPEEPTGNGTRLDLSPPTPWPDVVDGAMLLDDIAATFRRYVVAPDGGTDAMALWVMHAHAEAAAFVSPLLALTSPEKRCGKTTALAVIGALAPKALSAASITPAVIFRVVERYRPTLLVDEADTFLPGNDTLRGILNSGHTRATARVIRCEEGGDGYEPRIFSTWASKAVALIGKLPGTLEDRAVNVRLRRKAKGEKVDRLRLDRLEPETEPLRRQAARWVADHIDELKAADPSVPEILHDRAADNWRPLLAIADVAGGTWPERARAAALALNGAGQEASLGEQLLADLRAIFDDRAAEELSSETLLGALTSMDDRPWRELRHGKPINARGLARMLEPFGVRPKTIRMGERTPKGYVRTELTDAFTRYLE
jgi:putative DNA primase/helicase